MRAVRIVVVIAVLLGGAGGCDAEGGWFGFRSLGKRDASRIDRPATERR